ncbi:MAG: DNA cytosine methyltransferase [Deltaproteobacteria bacterium]|nr:DNA cytosine methyltransferase [Deltaproteobacteria bacterium]
MVKMKPRAADFYRINPPGVCSRRNRLTAVDLFAGAGGISLGLMNSGFDVLFASDISGPCMATHTLNLPNIKFQQTDIRSLSGAKILRQTGLGRGELDLLIGGPPCQGFSILGQRVLEDPRNRLFQEFVRIVGELKPRVAVIENVPGLATLSKGVLLSRIGAAFGRLGYRVECAELLAAQYGVPQMRWRMFFVAWRSDFGPRTAGFPVPTHGRLGIGDLVPNRKITDVQSKGFLSIWDAISDLPPIESGEVGTIYTNKPKSPYQVAMRANCKRAELHNHYAPKLSPINLQRIQTLQPGQDWRDLPRELLPPGMQRALRKDHTRRFRRMKWDGIARAIITRFRDPKSGEYIHPDQTRTISIREAARIQSFPDWFVFEGNYTDQYDQIGNAVPPLLARAVGTEIQQALAAASVERIVPKSRYKIPA